MPIDYKTAKPLQPLTNSNATLQTVYSDISFVRNAAYQDFLTTQAYIDSLNATTQSDLDLKEDKANKNAFNGYAGLTEYDIDFLNQSGTITSLLKNSNTAARRYTFPDQTGTVALISDIPVNPMTTAGDMIYENNTPEPDRLPIGNAGQILTVNSGLPSWRDLPIVGSLNYFWSTVVSDVITDYKQVVVPYTSVTSFSTAGVTNGQLLRTYITEPNNPNRSFIPSGEYVCHIHAAKTAGTKDAYLRAEIWETDSVGTDIGLIASLGSTAILTGSPAEYIIAYSTGIYFLASTTSRIATKLYAVVSGGGSAPTVAIYTGNGSDTRTNLPASVVDISLYVPYSGATTDVDLGANDITATKLIKAGGISTEFLKADGSVDSTAYGTGTVTSVAALTLGTTGTDLSSSVANGTTTPVITLNVPTASATNRGVLSTADWSTFNGKQDAGLSWLKAGNGGTTAGTDYIGTSDAIDFVVKTNAAERIRVLSTGEVGINVTPTTTNQLCVTTTTTVTLSAAMCGDHSGAADIKYGIKGTSSNATLIDSGVYGVIPAGTTIATNAYGVWGTNANTTAGNANYGMRASKTGAMGTGTGYGMYASATGTATNNYGCYFASSGATNNYGIYGTTTGAATINYGGYFSVGGATSNTAVYASATGTNNHALFIPASSGYVNIGATAAACLVHIQAPVLGDEVMRVSTLSTNDDPAEQIYQGRITTTDATVTTLTTITMASSETVTVHAFVNARRTGGAAGVAEDGAGYYFIGTYKNVAGTATIIGSVTSVHLAESQAGYAATLTVTGATILVRVTGIANTNMTWHSTVKVYRTGT